MRSTIYADNEETKTYEREIIKIYKWKMKKITVFEHVNINRFRKFRTRRKQSRCKDVSRDLSVRIV